VPVVIGPLVAGPAADALSEPLTAREGYRQPALSDIWQRCSSARLSAVA